MPSPEEERLLERRRDDERPFPSSRRLLEERRRSEVVKLENEKLREALRDLAVRLDRLQRRPVPDGAAALREELERLRTQMRQMSERVIELEKALPR